MGPALAGEITKLTPVQMIVCGLITYAVMAGLAWEEYTHRASVIKADQWPVCDGYIRKMEGGPFLGYVYQIGSKKYAGDRIYPDQLYPDMYIEKGSGYKVGQTVKVHYKPDDPTFAVLKTTPERGSARFGAYGIGIFFGTALIFRGFRRKSGYQYR